MSTSMSQKVRQTFVITVIILICVFCLIHEKRQNAQIQELSIQNESLYSQVLLLQANQDELFAQNNKDFLNGKAVYSKTAFNYLAIGNSITLHNETDYWWNNAGMAATTPDKDFVHIVAQHIKETTGDICFYVVNYSQWEMQSHDRAETYNIIDPYLSPELDLITIQLSENVTDITDFESDYIALIEYINQRRQILKY